MCAQQVYPFGIDRKEAVAQQLMYRYTELPDDDTAVDACISIYEFCPDSDVASTAATIGEGILRRQIARDQAECANAK